QKILKQSLPDFYMGFAANYYEQGYILLKKNFLEKDEEIMKKSLEYSRRSGDQISMGCYLQGLGEIFVAKCEIGKAKACFKQSIEAFDEGKHETAVNEVKSLIDNI